MKDTCSEKYTAALIYLQLNLWNFQYMYDQITIYWFVMSRESALIIIMKKLRSYFVILESFASPTVWLFLLLSILPLKGFWICFKQLYFPKICIFST